LNAQRVAVGCSDWLGLLGSNEVNQCLNTISHDLAAITTVVADVFWQKMSQVFAEALKLATTKKVAPKLCCVTAEMLNVRHVCRVSGLGITSADSLNVSEPPAEKSAEVVATVNSPATQGEPIRDKCGQNA
jgi:hypothetical protein